MQDLEYYDYQKMVCRSGTEKKWAKFAKLIQSDPDAKLVLISTPKNYDFNSLNVNLKKRIEKSGLKDGIQVDKSSAQSKQIVTFLPKMDSEYSNLELSKKGIHAFVKIHQFVGCEGEDSRLKNVVH